MILDTFISADGDSEPSWLPHHDDMLAQDAATGVKLAGDGSREGFGAVFISKGQKLEIKSP